MGRRFSRHRRAITTPIAGGLTAAPLAALLLGLALGGPATAAGSGLESLLLTSSAMRVAALDNARGGAVPGPLAQAEAPIQPVGEPPPEEDVRPVIQAAADVGGVLTRAGHLVFEPSLRYAHSDAERFTFRGVEIVETILIGVIEAQEARRDLVEAALTLRYGVTDRLEVGVRVPGLYREDRTSTLIPREPADISLRQTLDGSGLGDVEASLHLQLNRGGPGVPVLVGNLRGRFPTASKDPFDVRRDAFGVEQELPTGSGFYAIEPSLTLLVPTDPAVLFANLGYQHSFRRNVNRQIGDALVGRIDPGDSVRAGFGLSFAVNPQTSFSLTYAHDYVRGTKTEINGVTFRSESLHVGSAGFGVFHRLNERVGIDLSTAFGVTEAASDVTVTLRVPITLQLF